MIARLSESSPSCQKAPIQQTSSQLKRRRAKLLDVLLNTNWSKQSQQASNLIKLNKILISCDANFLDEKSGQSPLTLAIGSTQINFNQHYQDSDSSSLSAGYSHSTSLFNLQSHSNHSDNLSHLMLKQTNISDLTQSRAPLIQRILILLLKSGARIDFRNSDGRTPIHVAATKSNIGALKILLSSASNDYRDSNGLTPLYYSILYKADLRVTQMLLDHIETTSLNSRLETPFNKQHPVIGVVDQHGWQEVHQACKLGLEAHLEKLLYYGCDMNARITGSGNTPLHVAAINDQLDCVKVLLMRGADKTITNNSHQTAQQVAVISNNMNLAEFIASHDESKVAPFRERPSNFADSSQISTGPSTGFNTDPSHLIGSKLSAHLVSNGATITNKRATGIVQPQNYQNQLTLDVAALPNDATGSSSGLGSSSASSANSQAQSSVSMNNSNISNQHSHHHQHNQDSRGNNISPCLSQRSYATSNTTSSSGVCCEGDRASNSADELIQQQLINGNSISGSLSRHSNVTVVVINNKAHDQDENKRYQESITNEFNTLTEIRNDEDDEDDLRSSGSSGNELYSLISEERPLFVGSFVEATSEYQSGDPSHLQLHRAELIEILEFPSEILQSGQIPRLANKPMLFGRRISDNQCGLFPSFCVKRAKNQKHSMMRHKVAMNDITNSSNYISSNNSSNSTFENSDQQISNVNSNNNDAKSNNLSKSHSMASLDKQQQLQYQQNNHQKQQQSKLSISNSAMNKQDGLNLKPVLNFIEFQVTLAKTNGGFGFVLRGARINPETLANSQSNKLVIDERLMSSNNLASLQYLDEIEPGSVAQEAGLKRGDFLVAVNQQDVRLCSHEQVVQMIRQSGDQVHLTIATIAKQQYSQSQVNLARRSLVSKVKPEPPKRDPNTTLTRNRAQRLSSMLAAPEQNIELDQSKLLLLHSVSSEASNEPQASPTGSFNTLARSISTNLAHFNSVNSLSSTADSQSISSLSTSSVDHQRNQQQQLTPNHSSSSTTTLTTVATMKPQPLPKPNSVQMNSFAQQHPTYQPAAIITTVKRTSNQNLISPNNSNNNNNNANLPRNDEYFSDKQDSTVIAPSSTVTSTPTPPPPPPPLPDFKSPIIQPPKVDRFAQRRTSAPINQLPPFSLEINHLHKKRESLTIVNQSNASSTPSGPAQIGEVAAACAALANNRMQRQLQQSKQSMQNPQEQQQQNQQQPERRQQKREMISHEESVKPDEHSKDCNNVDQNSAVANERELLKQTDQIEHSHKSATNGKGVVKDLPKDTPNERKASNDRFSQMSSTLGRVTSAQIIQQPKASMLSQTQTLRAKPKRSAIPDYDKLPLPPPPLPPAPLNEMVQNSREMVHVTPHQNSQMIFCQHHHHHHHALRQNPNQQYEHQILRYQGIPIESIKQKTQPQEFSIQCQSQRHHHQHHQHHQNLQYQHHHQHQYQQNNQMIQDHHSHSHQHLMYHHNHGHNGSRQAASKYGPLHWPSK